MITNFFSNPQTWTIIAIIFGFGGLAGFASNFLDAAATKPTRFQNMRGIILGILASATVPLLLQMLSSNLLADAAAESYKYLVFGGYCVIVALFADRFLRGLGDNLLKKLTDLETKVEAARENADAALENSSATAAEGGEIPTEPAETDAEGEPSEAAGEEESEAESFNINEPKKARSPSSKSRSAAPLPPAAPPRSPRDRVVDALRDARQKTKTTEVIAKMTSLSLTDTTGWLADLESNGMAKRLKTADGKVFWKAV